MSLRQKSTSTFRGYRKRRNLSKSSSRKRSKTFRFRSGISIDPATNEPATFESLSELVGEILDLQTQRIFYLEIKQLEERFQKSGYLPQDVMNKLRIKILERKQKEDPWLVSELRKCEREKHILEG